MFASYNLIKLFQKMPFVSPKADSKTDIKLNSIETNHKYDDFYLFLFCFNCTFNYNMAFFLLNREEELCNSEPRVKFLVDESEESDLMSPTLETSLPTTFESRRYRRQAKQLK